MPRSHRRFRRLRYFVRIHEERIGLVLWVFVMTMGLAALCFGHFIDDSEWRNSLHDPALTENLR